MLEAAAAPISSRRPRKSLGQHFLADTRIAGRIISAAELSAADTVLEIGPGTGILTRRLVAIAGQVIAVEIDPVLAAELPLRLDYPGNLTVIQQDARTMDLSTLASYDPRLKMVANLPYYAATPILRRFLESDHPPALMVVMVQREVAEAMCAAPGSYTLLSVATQFYAAPSVVAQVPARSFRPPPKVASSVVKLVPRATPPADVADAKDFFAVVRAGFAAPRKQLRNSVMQGSACPPDVAAAVLEATGIDGRRRPATLTIPEWAALNANWPADVPRERDRTASSRHSRR
jgi:16S rRNA (adenine1518-N6/adenine1519-N6)-dimethyltransferase